MPTSGFIDGISTRPRACSHDFLCQVVSHANTYTTWYKSLRRSGRVEGTPRHNNLIRPRIGAWGGGRYHICAWSQWRQSEHLEQRQQSVALLAPGMAPKGLRLPRCQDPYLWVCIRHWEFIHLERSRLRSILSCGHQRLPINESWRASKFSASHPIILLGIQLQLMSTSSLV